MDKLKQNPFLAAMVGAGALLVILAGVLVYPAWDETGTTEKKVQGLQMSLSNAAMDTPGEEDIRSWDDGEFAASADKEKDYFGKVVWSYKNVVNFYLQYDFALEWWMTKGTPPADLSKLTPAEYAKLDETPTVGALGLKIQDAAKAIEKQLTDRGIEVGLKHPTEETERIHGFNWEKNVSAIETLPQEEQRAVLKLLQKRYWIRERVANVCLKDKDDKDKVKVKALVDVWFIRLLHLTKLTDAGPGGHDISYTKEGTLWDKVFKDRSRFDELDLPGGLGKTITFGVTVDLPYGEVSKFIRKFLHADLEPRMLVTILDSRVMVIEQNKPWDTFVYTKDENLSSEENAKAKAEAEEKFNKGIQPKPVRLQLLCQVIDFDTAKLPEWAKAHLPEWAKPKP